MATQVGSMRNEKRGFRVWNMWVRAILGLLKKGFLGDGDGDGEGEEEALMDENWKDGEENEGRDRGRKEMEEKSVRGDDERR